MAKGSVNNSGISSKRGSPTKNTANTPTKKGQSSTAKRKKKDRNGISVMITDESTPIPIPIPTTTPLSVSVNLSALTTDSNIETSKIPVLPGTPSSSTTSTTTINPALLTCKHIPSMPEFLKMYLASALRAHHNHHTIRCANCNNSINESAMMMVCIICGKTGCWSLLASSEKNIIIAGDNHLAGHNIEVSGHALWVELESGVVYCAVCKGWVWTDAMGSVWERARQGNKECPIIKTMEFLQPYIAATSITNNPTATTGAGEVGNFSNRMCPLVRGLYNLGNTCFMNSVLQTLFHTRPLRAHFLAPIRPAHVPPCSTTSTTVTASNNSTCIACEFDALYCKLVDGRTTPIAPQLMLNTLWQNARDLAGYYQQDAHELLVTLRNALHQKLGGEAYNCNCIIHNLFAGVLQSDLTCGSCGHVAETFDPCLDISLDLPTSWNETSILRLEDCLARFIKSETLPPGSITCAGCNREEVEMEKRMRIRQAPLVLAIHLKRFDGVAAKVDTPLRYPVRLKLDPFMVNNESGSEMASFPQYDLYAVICHVGGVDSGHYTAYIRNRGEWFLADDACVTACLEEEACNANAYMVFYQQQSMEIKRINKV